MGISFIVMGRGHQMVCCAGTNDIPYGSSPLHRLTQKVFVAKWPYVLYGMEKNWVKTPTSSWV